MFHNIFSIKQSEEIKNITKEKIIVDNREKNSLVASELFKLGLNIEFQQLPVADYIVKDSAIERKTISDLQSSIINKRIFSQIRDLKQFSKYLIIIEGFNKENHDNIINENALRGFLLSLSLDHKIPYIFTRDEKETALYIYILSRKKELSEISLRPSKIALSREEQLQYILEGFPNIGPVKAKALLKKFKSLRNIMGASETELQYILGKRTVDFVSLLK